MVINFSDNLLTIKLKKMKKSALFLIGLLSVNYLISQNNLNFNFEDLNVPDTGFYIGKDGNGGFGNQYLNFKTLYTDYGDFDYWDNFAFSYDTVTIDNQYINVTDTAFSQNIFGIGYIPQDWQSGTYENIPITCAFENPVKILSVYVTNDSTTSDVIRNGCPTTGSDPFSNGDYLKIIFEGRYNGQSTGFVEFFLANFTEDNNYIVNSWQNVDLSSLGTIDTLLFNLQSTDVGNYGMNTPAYFCIDDLQFTIETNVCADYKNNLIVYPNPADNYLNIYGNFDYIEIYNINGKFIKKLTTKFIDISTLKSGIYLIKSYKDKTINIAKFIKK